ncbi:putative mitochondrial DNA primase [Trypanosoma conorhini]|uniref:Putative mitochondrial DNA primase n=1 Tax=Trypanosoma conorhini TaxID=83891 RepID=A0A422P6F0_9TRYP|nr:putative mitochondrial DNA primase [Trypanosoma conorhini]RNF13244.1 putative mitochondrial DNA primase [Trypanosoma conorhini]
MFRFSLSARQASKRLIAELASITAKKEAGDGKPKAAAAAAAAAASETSAAASTAPPASTGDAAEASAAAATVRAAAESAMRQKANAEPVVASKLAKLARRLRKQKAARADATPGEPAGGDVAAPRVGSTDDAGDAPSCAAEAPKGADPADGPASSEGRPPPPPPSKKKKGKKKTATAPPTSKPHGQEEKGDAKATPAVASPPLPPAEAAAAAEGVRRQPKMEQRKEEATTATPPPTPEKSAPSQKKTPMIKAFRIEDVLSACTPSDGVFARRLPQGGCQFFAWPGTPLAIASNAVSTMPDTIRTVHAIFGREKTPIDLVLDIDCPVPPEHWSMSKVRPFQKKLLDDTMTVLAEEIGAIGEKIASQVVLQSPNLKKASFHVHTKLRDAAFEDYHSLHGFLHRFHKKTPHVDLQIYRPNGMLRMHRCMKENHTSAITVYEDKKWNIGFPNGVVPDAVAALHSACVRESGTYSRLLHFDAPRTQTVPEEGASAGAGGVAKGPATIPRVLLPLTEREAVETVSMWLRTGMQETDVGDWRSWIKLGINAFRIAHHFRDAQSLERPAMEELLDAWVEASKKCPTKYRPGICESKWSSFDIDKLCKLQDNDWWSSYQRIGRIAALNKAAGAGGAAKAAPSTTAERS